MSKPNFRDGPIQIDGRTGRIAMQWGAWYDEGDPLPHVGKTREEAASLLAERIGWTVLPQFQGGYTVTFGYLDEKARLIVAICTPKRGYAPVDGETLCILQESSVFVNATSPEKKDEHS